MGMDGTTESVWWNPSGLARMHGTSAAIHHSQSIGGKADAVSVVAHSRLLGSFGVSASLRDFGASGNSDDSGTEGGTILPRSLIYAATYAAPNSDVSRPVAQGGLGRLPVGGTETQTTNVALIQPGSLYGPRFNQIDARFGKVLRMGRTRAVVSLDLFNVLNSDTISSASSVYTTWLAPAAVVAPRLMKVSLTYDF